MGAEPAELLPRSHLTRDIALGLALFGVYAAVQALARPPRRAAADRHAADLLRFEQWIRIDVERTLNHWLAAHPPLATVANYEYAFTYIIAALLLLGWLYLRRPDAYPRARDSMLLLNAIAIACFALYPVTPPRFFPDAGYVDTVRDGHTWGSWGSPMVSHANQLAAMPSLHVAWALWVSLMLARIASGPLVQLLSAIHVLVTLYVIVATGNHFVVDAMGAVVCVAVSVWIVDRWHAHRDRRPPAVAAADAFFLHVEEAGAPQHVGGLVVLDGDPPIEVVRDLVRGELDRLPRFRQRLLTRSRWRRPRWIDSGVIDWAWHVSERPTNVPGDATRIVADLAAERFPRDRPLWRIVMVRDVAPGRSALVILIHHAVSDGIGTVVQALNLLRPRIELSGNAGPPPPSAVKVALATAAGLAQLATDGRPAKVLAPGSGRRSFATARLDLATIRAVARSHSVRVTDIVVCLVVTALLRVRPDMPALTGGLLRVSVPLMVREPGAAAEGNLTAAVMIDVPLGPMPTVDRLARIHASSDRLRTPTRALASRFVMARALGAAPEPAAAWFARNVYGRKFFHVVISNMPGPDAPLTFAGAPLTEVYPILPLAPDVPLVVGALSWNGALGVGLSADPAVLDVDTLGREIGVAVAELDDPASPILTLGRLPKSYIGHQGF